MTIDVGAIGVHEVLLWLAGRVDDDLLAWARELIAVGEDDQAVELITAALIADRVALPLPLRDWVVGRSGALQIEPDADQALAPADDDAPVHSFVGELADGSDTPDEAAAPLRAALANVAERHLHAGSWWLAWRLTPAGAAPGPLPHPVILVELEPDSVTSAEVVAYQVADAVQRGGLTASVEVFVAGATLPDYHRAALREARGDAPAPQEEEPRAAEPLATEPPPSEPSPYEPLPYGGPVADSTESWSDEWVTGEWSESPGSPPPAALSDTEKVLLAELQDELTRREGQYERANGDPSSGRPDIADPPGLAG